MAKINVEVNINDFVDKRITTIEELKSHILYDYGYSSEDFDKEYNEDEDIKYVFDKYKSYLDQGLEVIIGYVSDEDGSPIESLICNEGIDLLDFNDDIEVIEGEGGY